jgi:hypothetical protein
MTGAVRADSGHFHAVKFYKDASSLADIVCTFLAEGLRRGEPAVIIATPAHTRVFLECFTTMGIDVDRWVSQGALTLLDADTTLDTFMRDGVPMAGLFTDTLTHILKRVESQFPRVTIRA